MSIVISEHHALGFDLDTVVYSGAIVGHPALDTSKSFGVARMAGGVVGAELRDLRTRSWQAAGMRSTLLLLLSLTACSKDKPSPATEPPAQVSPAPETVSQAQRARAAALVGELKKSLLAAVSSALGHGAPAAIETCHAAAPSLTAAVSREGAIVGRTTRKLRNPANAASGWRLEALEYFENLHANRQPLAGQTFAKLLDGGRVAYAEPLVMQELCLTCHGETLAPEVQSAIAAKYPEDRATGYAAGDLRGIAWAELPASPPER